MRRLPDLAEAVVVPTGGALAGVPAAAAAPPYVGPRPFERNESRFYGRDREALDLMYLVLAHPTVLLYAESGAGKSSLVNAKLIPMLEQKGCHVLPVARVRGPIYDIEPSQIDNIFVLHALADWTGLSRATDAPRLTRARLHDELKRISDLRTQDPEDVPQIVAVIDQFEELFTHYDHRWKERRGLFEQIAEALHALPNLRVLFSMREDYIAGMDSFAPLLPENLRTRFRLERLKRDSALEAIRRPMEDVGRHFLPGVAEQLVDDLMKIHVVRLDAGAGGGPTGTRGQPRSGAGSPERPEFKLRRVPPGARRGCSGRVHRARAAPGRLPDTLERPRPGRDHCDIPSPRELRRHQPCIGRILRTMCERRLPRRRPGRGRCPPLVRGQAHHAHGDAQDRDARGVTDRAAPQRRGGFARTSCHIIRSEDRGGVRWYELLCIDRSPSSRSASPTGAGGALARREPWTGWKPRRTPGPRSRRPNGTPGSSAAKIWSRAETWLAGDNDAAELGHSDRLAEYLKESRSAPGARRLRGSISSGFGRGAWTGLTFVVLFTLGGWWIRSWIKSNDAWNKSNEALAWAEKAHSEQRKAEAQAANAEVLAQASRAYYVTERNPQEGLKFAVYAADPVAAQKFAKSPTNAKTFAARALRHVLVRARQRLVINDNPDELTDLDFSPDGRLLALLAQDGSARILDIDRPSDVRVVDTLPPDAALRERNGRVNRIIFDAKGDHLVVVCGDPTSVKAEAKGSARLWTRAGTGSKWSVTELPGHTGPVTEAAFSPDGQFLATASLTKNGGGQVQIFSIQTCKPVCQPIGVATEPINCVGFGRSNRLCLATGIQSNEPGTKGRAAVYELAGGDQKLETHFLSQMRGYEGPISHAVFNPDGSLVAAGCSDGAVRVFDVKNGDVVATLLGHSQQVASLAFNDDGSQLVTASGDRTARVWDAGRWLAGRGRDWQSTATLSGHRAALYYAEFSPDGSLVLTCSYDKTARLWDARTGEGLVTFPGHSSPVYTARFSTDGRLVATVSADKTARVWDVGQVEPPQRLLAGHAAAVRDAVLDGQGRRALTASADGTARLWGPVRPPGKLRAMARAAVVRDTRGPQRPPDRVRLRPRRRPGRHFEPRWDGPHLGLRNRKTAQSPRRRRCRAGRHVQPGRSLPADLLGRRLHATLREGQGLGKRTAEMARLRPASRRFQRRLPSAEKTWSPVNLL